MTFRFIKHGSDNESGFETSSNEGIDHNFSSQAHRKRGWGILIIFRQTQVESKEHESQAQRR